MRGGKNTLRDYCINKHPINVGYNSQQDYYVRIPFDEKELAPTDNPHKGKSNITFLLQMYTSLKNIKFV